MPLPVSSSEDLSIPADEMTDHTREGGTGPKVVRGQVVAEKALGMAGETAR